MSLKTTKISLLISFFLCYLEWGNNKSAFIFNIVYTLFFENFSVGNFFHPIILLSLISVITIIYSLFQKVNLRIEKTLFILLTFLVLFFLFIGVISLRYKVVISTLPFLILINFYFIKQKKEV